MEKIIYININKFKFSDTIKLYHNEINMENLWNVLVCKISL